MTLAIHEARPLSAQDNPMAVALATYNDKTQLAVIRDQICPGATPGEMWVFLARCVSLGLDPYSRQMFFIKRQDKVSHQIGIDGFRSIAERTGELVGISEAEYEGDAECQGKPVPGLARVTVTREIRGKDREFVGVARWTEFYPGDKLGFMWQKMPAHMLGKCAEAQAMRKAFPQQIGGLQTDAEAFNYEAVMAAGDSQRVQRLEPQYVEVTDTKTGEMKQVRAGDEYVRQYESAYESEARETAAATIKPQAPPDRAEYAEGNAVARRAADALSEVIDAAPEPPDDDDRLVAAAAEQDDEPAQALGQVDGSDSSTSDEAQEQEPMAWDYGLCLEIYQNNPGLTLDKPLPRLKPEAYAKWHADYAAKLDAKGGLPF